MKKLLLCVLFVCSFVLSGCFGGKKDTKKDTIITPPVVEKEDKAEGVDQENDMKEDEKDEDEKKEGEETDPDAEYADEFDENGEFDPKKFEDEDVEEVMDLLKDLLKE